VDGVVEVPVEAGVVDVPEDDVEPLDELVLAGAVFTGATAVVSFTSMIT